MVQLGDLAVVNTKEFVNAGDHGFLAALAFGALLLNELIHNVTFGLEAEFALHNLEANSA